MLLLTLTGSLTCNFHCRTRPSIGTILNPLTQYVYTMHKGRRKIYVKLILPAGRHLLRGLNGFYHLLRPIGAVQLPVTGPLTPNQTWS